MILGTDDYNSGNIDSNPPSPYSQGGTRISHQFASGHNEGGYRRKLSGSNDHFERVSQFDARQIRPVGRGSVIGDGDGCIEV